MRHPTSALADAAHLRIQATPSRPPRRLWVGCSADNADSNLGVDASAARWQRQHGAVHTAAVFLLLTIVAS